MASFDKRTTTSASPNREEMLQLAIRAAQSGNRESAEVMFRQVLDEDKRNERALLWMVQLATTKEERRQWLSRVLVVNPYHQAAKDALKRMEYKSSARDNRVLVIFGVVAAVLIVLGVVIFALVLTGQ